MRKTSTSRRSTKAIRPHRHQTHHELVEIGLAREEIRLLGAYRGLTREQQAALLVILSNLVIENARQADKARTR